VKEGQYVRSSRLVCVCVCVCVRKEIKTAEEVDSHLLLAAFLFPFLILFAQRESSFQSLVQERDPTDG
jgi:hypothetical protein